MILKEQISMRTISSLKIVILFTISFIQQSFSMQQAFRNPNLVKRNFTITPSLENQNIPNLRVNSSFYKATDKDKNTIRLAMREEYRGLSKQEKEEKNEQLMAFGKSLQLKLAPLQLINLSDQLFEQAYSYSVAPKNLKNLPVEDYSCAKEIDSLQNLRRTVFLFLPEDMRKVVIKGQLKTLENKLSEDILEAKRELVKAFGMGVDNPYFKAALIASKKAQAFLMQNMKKKRDDAQVDTNLSLLWTNWVSRVIRLADLEPSSLDLVLGVNSNNDLDNTFAWNSTGTPRCNDNGKYIYEAPVIGLGISENERLKLNYQNPLFANIYQHAAFHEVVHTIKGHAPSCSYLVNAISLFLNQKIADMGKKIKIHPAYFHLCLAQEKEADVFHATKYPKAAECAMAIPMCPTMGGALYKGSYPLVAIADTNWKMLRDINDRK